MSKTFKYLLIILSLVLLIVCSIWYYEKPGFDSGASALTSLIALIGFSIAKTKDTTQKGNTKMSQKAGDNSTQYQAGGNMRVK